MFGSRALDSRLRSDCELPCPSTSACLEPVQCQKETGLPLVCRRCARGLFGIDCGLNCEQGDCVGLVACDLDGGSRSCAACRSGYWDPTCTERCTQGSCLGVVTCDQSDGKQRKCALCKAGTWGDSCGRTCKASNCLGEVVCHQQTGETLRCNRCKPGESVCRSASMLVTVKRIYWVSFRRAVYHSPHPPPFTPSPTTHTSPKQPTKASSGLTVLPDARRAFAWRRRPVISTRACHSVQLAWTATGVLPTKPRDKATAPKAALPLHALP